MISIRVSRPNLQPPRLNSADLRRIADYAIGLIRKRVGRGLNIREQRMKPLTASSAKAKREHGQPPIRNLMQTGAMMRALQVIQSRNGSVTIGWNDRVQAVKAAANQRRDEWFPLSKREEEQVIEFAQRILQSK